MVSFPGGVWLAIKSGANWPGKGYRRGMHAHKRG
jgi:hypothetical protein